MNLLKNKYFILGNILLLLAVIPLTLFVVKKQTDLRSKAAPTTVLSFAPTTASASAGQNTTLDVFVDPGQNIVSIIEMTIQVDPDKLEIVSLANNDAAFPLKLKGPTINTDGTVNMSISTSNDTTKAIQTKTKIATLTLKGKAATSGAPSIVKFDKAKSQVFSLATADGETENVLSDTGTASVTVSGTSQPGGIKPVCSALVTDKNTTGTAPYALTFTGRGSTATGVISKATFIFGDGTSQEVTNAGGVGTNNVNVQISHTYTNPGTYTASVILTDNNGNASTPDSQNSNSAAACSKVITVNAVGGGGNNPGAGSPTPSVSVAPTAVPTLVPATPTPTSTQAQANPGSGGSGGSSGSGGSGGQSGGQAQPTLPVTGTLETTLAILGGVSISILIGVFLFVL